MAKVIFRLNLQGKTPSTWAIPQSNVMARKDDKGNKFIDYYPGQDSCFVEDIQAKNKDLRPSKVPLFEYSVSSKQTELAVDEQNVALIRYLKTHPWFGVKYSIFSKDGQAKKDLTEFENVEKALELIKESDELKVQAISMAIFGLSSFNKSYTQCAAELKAKAIREPLVIIQAMEATNYETKYVSGLAFVSNIIKLNPTHTAIVWADSSEGVILHVAQGENGLDKLTNFLTNESKEAQVLKVALKDKEGFDVAEYFSNQEIYVHITLKNSLLNQGARLNFSILDKFENVIFINRRDLDFTGVTEWRVQLPSNVLIANQYKIGLALDIPKIKVLDFPAEKINLSIVNIEQEEFKYGDTENGIFKMPIQWKR